MFIKIGSKIDRKFAVHFRFISATPVHFRFTILYGDAENPEEEEEKDFLIYFQVFLFS